MDDLIDAKILRKHLDLKLDASHLRKFQTRPEKPKQEEKPPQKIEPVEKEITIESELFVMKVL